MLLFNLSMLLVLIELLLLAMFLVSQLISRWFRLNVASQTHQKSNNIINSIPQNGGFSRSFKNNTLISWDRRGLASTSIYQQRCDSWRYQRHQRAEKCNTSLSRNFPLLWAKFNKAEPLNIDGCRGSETFGFFLEPLWVARVINWRPLRLVTLVTNSAPNRFVQLCCEFDSDWRI